MRKNFIRLLSLLLISTLSTVEVNAASLRYDFTTTSPSPWDFSASFTIDSTDIIVFSNVASDISSWSADWNNGSDFFSISSATEALSTSWFQEVYFDSTLDVFDISLCTETCGDPNISSALIGHLGSQFLIAPGVAGNAAGEWSSGVTVGSVPEPHSVLLIVFGLLVYIVTIRRSEEHIVA